MAKSLRSKRMRKMRAIKRIRYGEKELKRLKSILPNSDLSSICTVLPQGSLSKETAELTVKVEVKDESSSPKTDGMEIDAPTRKYHSKKLTDENGHYPPWMSQRAIRKHKAKMGRISKKAKKQRKRKT